MSNSGWLKLGIAVGGAVLGGWLLAPFLGGFAAGAGFIGGTLLGNALFPIDNEADNLGRYEDYPIQSSAVGTPILIVYGTAKIAGNIIWMGDLDSYQIAHSVSGGGGKGGGGDESKTYETQYRRSFLVALCEGPATVSRAWKGKEEILISSFTVFNGDNNTGISALTGKDYTEYSNICCVFFEDYKLGNSQTTPNFTFEVNREGEFTKVCDLFVVGAAYSIPGGTANSVVELCDAYGNYSHTTLTTTQTARKILAHPDGDYCVAYGGNVAKVASDGTARWSNSYSGSACNDLYIDAQGYIYVVTTPHYPTFENRLLKLDPDDGSILWGNMSANVGGLVDIVGSPDLYTAEYSGPVKRHSTADGSVLWAGPNIGGASPNVGMAVDDHNLIYTNSASGGKGVLFCTPSDVSSFYGDFTSIFYTFNSGTVLSGIKTISGGDSAYTTLICVGVNNSSSGLYYVALLGLTIPPLDPATSYLSVISTYSVGGTIYDITTDNDGGWLVCHNKGTGESGETGHITKFGLDINLDLNYLGVLEVANDRPGFVKSVARSDGTHILASAESATDVNFASIIQDLLINPRIGGYSADDLITEDFKDIVVYCEDNDLKGSLAITDQKPLPDWISYICSHFQGYFYEIGGKIGLNCYRNQSSVLSITQDDLVVEGDEPPVQITKRSYQSTYNRLEVTWTNRENEYKVGVIPAFDRVDQRESGQIRTKTLDLKMITDADLASKMAWRLFIDQMYRFSQYTFKLGYKSMLLEVGDVIDITDGCLLTAQKMRVLSKSEQQNGRIATITAMEDISDFYPSIQYEVQESERQDDSAITLTDGTIFFRESWDSNKLYLSIVPGGAQVNGFYIYRSYDDVSYSLVGTCAIAGVTGGDANSTGTLQTPISLPAHTAVTHRSKESFHVNIGTLTDLYTATTDDSFFNNRKLALVGNEIIGYKVCEEMLTEGVWRVSNLIRGLFGTQPIAHSSGETFATLDVNFIYNMAEAEVGKTLYFKVVSFYGNNVQLVSDVSSFSHQIQGVWKRPAAASLVRIQSDANGRQTLQYTGISFTLYWNLPCDKGTGWNQGGFDLNSLYSIWKYGNDLSELVGGSGVTFGNELAEPDLQTVDLVFEKVDGTFISQRSVAATTNSTTIDKTTDLDGNATAVIKVYPKTSRRGIKAESITVIGV